MECNMRMLEQLKFDMATDVVQEELAQCDLHLALFWGIVDGILLPGVDAVWLDAEEWGTLQSG